MGHTAWTVRRFRGSIHKHGGELHSEHHHRELDNDLRFETA